MGVRRSAGAFAFTAMLAVARDASADVPPPAASADAASAPHASKSAALPTALSVVPGVLVHGAGHAAANDWDGARLLLATEGIGVGMMGLGLGGIYASGASRKLVGPAAAVAVLGAGLFFASWASDVYGNASGATTNGKDGGSTASALLATPAVETAAGLRYVQDPAFSHRAFFVNSVDLRVGRMRLRPEGWFALDRPNERLKLLLAGRIVGPRAATLDGHAPEKARDGSFVDLEIAGVRHAFPPERFRITSVELDIAARLDLVRLHRTLRGSFTEATLGYGILHHSYAVNPAVTADISDQLLARWAWGVYFGRPNATGVGPAGGITGEASVFYDHRHDGYAGGLLMPGLFSGVLGSFGARALAYFTDEIGALAEIQAGSAVVFGASILLRQPVRP